MDLSAYLNKDILLEISKYVLYYDIRSLKLALPDIGLTKELYLTIRKTTLSRINIFKNVVQDDLLARIAKNPMLCSYIFTIDKSVSPCVFVVDCAAIDFIFKVLEIESPRIRYLTMILPLKLEYPDLPFDIGNKYELIERIFRSRKINNIIQVTDIERYESDKPHESDVIKNIITANRQFLSDIVNYYDEACFMLCFDTIVFIYDNLDRDSQQRFLLSIDDYIENGIYLFPKTQLRKFYNERIGK